jgi:hypothetical protein
MSDLSPGMTALLGRLHVLIGKCEASFELAPGHPTVRGNGPHPSRAEILVPGATIGRGSDADLRLVGAASEGISRRHLLVMASGRQWTVADRSSVGTYEESDGPSGWQRLPEDFPLPVEDGMVLCLGDELLLRFELEEAAPGGATTAPRGSSRRVGAERIRPRELEVVAAALLASSRAGGRGSAIPPVSELAETLAMSRAAVYRRAADLRRLDEVAPLVIGNDLEGTARAVAIAFPYLVAASGGSPSRDDASDVSS